MENKTEAGMTIYCAIYSDIVNTDGDDDCCYVPLRRFTNPLVGTYVDAINDQLGNLIMMYFQLNTGHIVSTKGNDRADLTSGSRESSMLVTNSALVVYFGKYVDSVSEQHSCKPKMLIFSTK